MSIVQKKYKHADSCRRWFCQNCIHFDRQLWQHNFI